MKTGIRFGLVPLLVLFFCGTVFAGSPAGSQQEFDITAMLKGKAHKSSASQQQADSRTSDRSPVKDDRRDYDNDRSGRGHSAIKVPGGRDDERNQRNDRSPAHNPPGLKTGHFQASFKHDPHPGIGHQKVKPKNPGHNPPRGQVNHYAWYYKPHWKPGHGGPWHGFCRPGFNIWCQKVCGDTSPSSPCGSKKWGNRCTPGQLAKCQECGFLD